MKPLKAPSPSAPTVPLVLALLFPLAAFAGEIQLTVTRRSADSHSHRPAGESFVYRQPVELGAGEERKLLFEQTGPDAGR